MSGLSKSSLVRTTCICAVCLCVGPATVAETAPDEVFGARDDAIGPLGGGKGYSRLVTKFDHLVKTKQQLIDHIHHNTFRATHEEALKIRGVPREKAEVHHNWFLDLSNTRP